MSRLFALFLLTLFLNIGAGNEFFLRAEFHEQDLAAQGTALARAVQDRDSGRDARTAMRMRLYDRQNRLRERALTVATLRAVRGKPASGDRTLVRFTYPADIKGTGFLVWEHASAEDERFLFLPSLGRVRRIAGSETQESFVGSDFSYEDIGGREFDDYTYTLIQPAGAPKTWTSPDGTTYPVSTLESRSRDANARFPRVVSLVRQDNFVVVHADIHNRRGELQKVFDVTRLDRVSGFWTSMAMVMRDALQRTRTELVVEKAEYNIGLTEDDFSRKELERGGGR